MRHDVGPSPFSFHVPRIASRPFPRTGISRRRTSGTLLRALWIPHAFERIGKFVLAEEPVFPDEDEALRVVSSRDPLRYSGHAEARARQLLMMPEAGGVGAVSLRKALVPRPAGHLWTLRNAAGLTVALRARDFPQGKYARRDARAIASRRRELVITHVVDPDGRQRGWWLSLVGRVVLTSARIRGISQRDAAEREVRSVLRLFVELDESEQK